MQIIKMIFLKIAHARWMLVLYDLAVYVFSSFVFLVYFRGGGSLQLKGMIIQATLTFVCLFGSRFLWNIYGQIWRYGGIQCYIRLLASDFVACVVYSVIDLALPVSVRISISRVISIVGVVLFISLAMRMIYRYAYKCGNDDSAIGRILNRLLSIFAGKEITKQRNEQRQKKRVAIVGAGRVGVNLAEELLTNATSSYLPVCFIDIERSKIGREIHNIPVVDEKAISQNWLLDHQVEELVVAMPSMNAKEKKHLYEKYRTFGVPIKIYDFPVMRIAGSKRQLRNFEIEDVLFRNSIDIIDEKTVAYYKDKIILVTGGGGSIGSELSRQVARMNPKQLIVLDIYENGVYDVQQDLKMIYGNSLDVKVEIVSITNKVGLEVVFDTYRPQIVINAAAHKHVPLMEHNCFEAVINNVFGTENVVQLCEKYGVERFMALSTDKAVNPTNVMGATKRMCEFIMQAHSTKGHVKYSATRFGNVLGSAGSVIPLFKRQIANGGPITLTDKRIIRYFMTIPEASQLVLQSGAMAQNGELFVLDMGEPVKILDLAESMIKLSGLTPYEDIEIIETGLRPGEKLYEELLVKSEDLDKTDNNLIFIEKDKPISMEELEAKFTVLRDACKTQNNDLVRDALKYVVPTFKNPEQVNGNIKEREKT